MYCTYIPAGISSFLATWSCRWAEFISTIEVPIIYIHSYKVSKWNTMWLFNTWKSNTSWNFFPIDLTSTICSNTCLLSPGNENTFLNLPVPLFWKFNFFLQYGRVFLLEVFDYCLLLNYHIPTHYYVNSINSFVKYITPDILITSHSPLTLLSTGVSTLNFSYNDHVFGSSHSSISK